MTRERRERPPGDYLKWAEEIARRITGEYGEEEYEPGRREEFDISDELRRFLEIVVQESNRDLGEPEVVKVKNDPKRRHVVRVDGEPGLFVAIHDPMEGVVGAESISGADILVETIDGAGEHSLLITQVKRTDQDWSGVTPKQLFGLGSMYMFGQYLMGNTIPWVHRFEDVYNYANLEPNPHNEYIFLKYIPEHLYVPLSTILSTQDFLSAHNLIDLSTELIYRHSSELFADLDDGKADYYEGFDDFSRAYLRGEIGLPHPGTPRRTGFKTETNYRVSDMNQHLGVAFLEVERSYMDKVAARLSNPGKIGPP